MDFVQNCKPSRLNLDKSKKYLLPNESAFLRNHDVNNPNAFGKATPLAANEPACDLQLPAGENYSPNNHYSPLTNENYTWHYNSNNVHFISRINGDGECDIIYNGDCLQISADPKHEITQFRAILDQDFLCNKVPGGALKRLVWTDGTATPMGCIDVEASISTNFFTTPFFDICDDPCAYIQLCVPEVDGCIVGEWIPVTDADKGKGNLMLDMGIKVAIRHIYYDNRTNELSDRSTLYFQDSKGCFDNSEGYPRCMKFRIPIGNPMVDKIEFYVSENGGLTWFLRDTIEKYKKYNSAQQYWYQRDLSELVSSTFSATDCSFDYVFCNDKQRIPIDPKLLTRVTNPIPREAQGIFRIKDTIAAYNYLSGTCPVDKNELDKITLTYDCIDTVSCETEFAKVTVRAVIYNHKEHFNGAIMRANGANGINVETPDDKTDPAVFYSPTFAQVFGPFDQVFREETRNFIVYIEGTDYWGEMEQWRSTPNFVSVKKVGTLAGESPGTAVGADLGSFNSGYGTDIHNGNFYYQEYTFTVPKGTKGFLRLASHYQTNGTGGNQNTSTQVTGIIANLADYTGTTTLELDGLNREIYFDTCNGDVNSMQAFIVDDLYEGEDATAYFGYITNNEGLPVEGAKIYKGDYNVTTDYNGYYVINNDVDAGQSTELSVRVELNCNSDWQEIEQFSVRSDVLKIMQADYQIQSQYVVDEFYAKADVLVKDCNNNPIRGLRVAMSGSKYKITDINGIAHFKLKNYVTRSRSVVAVVMDKGNCFSVDCFGNCNPCLPSTPSTTLMPCFLTKPTYNLAMNSNLDVADILANKKSLKKGGIYDMAIVVEGDCGKISAAYPITTFNIPRLQETGSYSTCTFSYNTNGALFPAWADKVKIVRSANLNPFVLQWVVDDFEKITDGNLILTIQSLNDYNARYNFKTNTIYQFLQGDRVEFIRNGDGKIFDSLTNGILNYQVLSPYNDEDLSGITDDIDYFNQIKITDDGKLDNLKKGAIIQTSHLALSTPQVTYYEMCANFSITNGVADNPTGTFETFDTYLVSRQIGSFPPQYFEHKSPSDFWGEIITDGISTFLSDVGKAHFLNPYENEKRYPRSISINSATQLNYFGDYIKTLDAEEQGAIIAINVKDDKIGLALCENDSFLFQINDDLLRVGTDGIVRAAPIDSIIGNAEPKIRGEYGVSYEDIGSILFGDGFATFADYKNSAYVLHNYSIAQMCGLVVNQQSGLTETTCNSFFQKRMQQKANFNKTATDFLDHYRWSVGQNKTNNVVYLTIKSLRQAGVNNSKWAYELLNETILYTPITDCYLGFASFTPENYSQLSLNTDGGCSILMYQNSLPHVMPIVPHKWNEFFGIAVDEMVAITVSGGNKVIVPLSAEVQSGQMWFVYDVSTDNPNFRSEVPPVRVKRNNNKWNFALLNDINSRGGLYGGTAARGYYVNLLLIKDNTVNLQYGSINDAKRTVFNELDSILIKGMVSEQSGFTENI